MKSKGEREEGRRGRGGERHRTTQEFSTFRTFLVGRPVVCRSPASPVPAATALALPGPHSSFDFIRFGPFRHPLARVCGHANREPGGKGGGTGGGGRGEGIKASRAAVPRRIYARVRILPCNPVPFSFSASPTAQKGDEGVGEEEGTRTAHRNSCGPRICYGNCHPDIEYRDAAAPFDARVFYRRHSRGIAKARVQRVRASLLIIRDNRGSEGGGGAGGMGGAVGHRAFGE